MNNSDSFVLNLSCDWQKNVGWSRLSSLLDIKNLRGNNQNVRFEMQFIKHGGFQCHFTFEQMHSFCLLYKRTKAVVVKWVQDQGGTSQIVGHVPSTLLHVFH